MRPERVVRGLGVVAAMSFTVACAGGPGQSDGEPSEGRGAQTPGSGEAIVQACVPVEHSLVATSTLASMAGTYSLTLMSGAEMPVSAEGRLTLAEVPAALREMGGAATPLAGSTDVDVQAVGALRMGDLGSTDPNAPGVLVIETAPTNILLRLGSESNRRDEASFDGGYTILTVHRIANGGFDGNWRSGSRDGTTRGYFCARPTGE